MTEEDALVMIQLAIMDELKFSTVLLDPKSRDGHIKALRIAEYALKKQIPKKPKIKKEKQNGSERIAFICPVCGSPTRYADYCNRCGQALNWREDEQNRQLEMDNG